MEKNESNRKGCIFLFLIMAILVAVVSILFLGGDKDVVDDEILTGEDKVQLDGTYEGEETFEVNQNANSILENIGFGEFNKERLVKIKVKVDEEYIYESDFMKPEDVIKEDIMKDQSINVKGKHVVAEIYSYTTEKEFIEQTNIVIS